MSSVASLIEASSKELLAKHLNAEIVRVWKEATQSRSSFTIALSGGSLPTFLSSMETVFKEHGVDDPKFNDWHVLLADERCVPQSHEDSNMGALQEHFFQHVAIPSEQIYGIDESMLNESTDSIAAAYETVVRRVLDQYSDGKLDLAVLGFGPDGHTCSLFPQHALLQETTKWVAGIDDSPKPPPRRITLTFPVLNEHTRHALFCGAGDSKGPILRQVLQSVVAESATRYTVTMTSPPPFPCAMVKPLNSVTWVVDAEAMKGVAKSA